MDTWYIVSKERHEGLSWWHRQVHGLSEPQGIQGQPEQFIETLSKQKKKSQQDNHNPVRKGISAKLLSGLHASIAVCTPTHTNKHVTVLKVGGMQLSLPSKLNALLASLPHPLYLFHRGAGG